MIEERFEKNKHSDISIRVAVSVGGARADSRATRALHALLQQWRPP